MENPNFRPMNDADHAAEIAWRISKYWPISRRMIMIQLCLSAMMSLVELVNTVLSIHYGFGRCQNGIGFHASFFGTLAAVIGYVALSIPWRRRRWFFAYFPMVSLSTLGSFAVMIFSIYCLMGFGNHWKKGAAVYGTIMGLNLVLIAIAMIMCFLNIAIVVNLFFYLPWGRFRETLRTPAEVNESKELGEPFINQRIVSGSFVRFPFVRTPLVEVHV